MIPGLVAASALVVGLAAPPPSYVHAGHEFWGWYNDAPAAARAYQARLSTPGRLPAGVEAAWVLADVNATTWDQVGWAWQAPWPAPRIFVEYVRGDLASQHIGYFGSIAPGSSLWVNISYTAGRYFNEAGQGPEPTYRLLDAPRLPPPVEWQTYLEAWGAPPEPVDFTERQYFAGAWVELRDGWQG